MIKKGSRVKYDGDMSFMKGITGTVESVIPPLIINGVVFSSEKCIVKWDDEEQGTSGALNVRFFVELI